MRRGDHSPWEPLHCPYLNIFIPPTGQLGPMRKRRLNARKIVCTVIIQLHT